MFAGCLACLAFAAGFLTEVPPLVRARIASTNETHGTFVQTKRDRAGRAWVSRGTWRIRPGRDFTWSVREPFAACFRATPERYVYTNEDERVERLLKDLPGAGRFDAVARGDVGAFFRAFDALWKEEEGRFYAKAKPKVGELKELVSRIDAGGTPSDWTLDVLFARGDSISIRFTEAEKDGRP